MGHTPLYEINNKFNFKIKNKIMKKINKIKLSSLSNEDLNKREMNKLLGGDVCCVCHCYNYESALTTEGGHHETGFIDPWGGYGTNVSA